MEKPAPRNHGAPLPRILRGLACAASFLAWQAALPADPLSSARQVFFDDFSYASRDELEAHGWIVRTRPGWPGIEGASWEKEGVSFAADPAQPGGESCG